MCRRAESPTSPSVSWPARRRWPSPRTRPPTRTRSTARRSNSGASLGDVLRARLLLGQRRRRASQARA
eukprot:4613277-Alexandrium_andersonii.AAC.1